MRILFIGNPYTRSHGARDFGFGRRFFNGLVRNQHHVLYYADREISRAASFKIFKKRGRHAATQGLWATLKVFRPHAIVFVHVGDLSSDTMLAVRAAYPDIRIAYLNVDALYMPTNIHNFNRMKTFCDAVFVTSGGPALQRFSTETCRFHFMPNVVDPGMDTGRAFLLEQPPYDLAAILNGGHNLPADQAQRIEQARLVARQVDGLQTCYRGFDGQPQVLGIDYLKALGDSAMTLCLNRHQFDGMQSTPETRFNYSSSRTGHALGNGSLAFTSTDFDQTGVYTDQEMVFFGSDEELVDKVRFYKTHPSHRQKVAHTGWEKAHTHHNVTTVMKYAMERLFDIPLSQTYAWPVS